MYDVNVKFSGVKAVWKTVTRVQRKRSTAGIFVYVRRNGVGESEFVFAHKDLKRAVVPLENMCENMKWYTAPSKGVNNRIGRTRSKTQRHERHHFKVNLVLQPHCQRQSSRSFLRGVSRVSIYMGYLGKSAQDRTHEEDNRDALSDTAQASCVTIESIVNTYKPVLVCSTSLDLNFQFLK